MQGHRLIDLAPDFSDPLGLISACHERMQHFCSLLERLAKLSLSEHSHAPTKAAASAVLRYFDIAAPLHHQDEEQDLFPMLRAEPQITALLEQLQAQHRELDLAWAAVRPALVTLTEGQTSAQLTTVAMPFVAAMRAHLSSEDKHVLPAARAELQTEQVQALGRAMAARRR